MNKKDINSAMVFCAIKSIRRSNLQNPRHGGNQGTARPAVKVNPQSIGPGSHQGFPDLRGQVNPQMLMYTAD